MTIKATLIQLPPRSHSCQHCEVRFSRGNDYYSLLFGNELFHSKKEPIVRRDICLSCWNSHPHTFEKNASTTYWKSSIPLKQSAKEPLSRAENALNLLKMALKENAGSMDLSDYEMFFLAIYLVRKKMLIHRKMIEQSGTHYQLFEVADSEEILAIKKVDLSKADIPMLQKVIAQKLYA